MLAYQTAVVFIKKLEILKVFKQHPEVGFRDQKTLLSLGIFIK
jgi:hypothetical protein